MTWSKYKIWYDEYKNYSIKVIKIKIIFLKIFWRLVFDNVNVIWKKFLYQINAYNISYKAYYNWIILKYIS